MEAASSDLYNILPAAHATDVYDLYIAPKASSTSTINRAAIVKSIRLVNTSGASVKVTLYFNHPGSFDANGNASGGRRRFLTPADMVLPANFIYIDNDELTLAPGDRIQGKSDTLNAIQFLISGVERDA
jgi:hypothetical protein